MVGAKLSIPSDEEGSPQNPTPPSPPSPPAGNLHSRGRRRSRPIPPPRSDPLGRYRRRTPRRERGAKLEEYPASPPSSPPPRQTLDLRLPSPEAPALPVPAAPPPPDRSDPKKWRRLLDYFYRYRILPSWATGGGGVEAAGSSEAAPCTDDGDGVI